MLDLSKLDITQFEANAGAAAKLLRALANERRLMILCQLTEGERSVGQLLPLVGLSQSALSQHLSVLRRKHLVRTRRAGQSIYYSLTSGDAAAVMGSRGSQEDGGGVHAIGHAAMRAIPRTWGCLWSRNRACKAS